MKPADKRRRYREDPEFRAKILDANKRARSRDANPNRKRLNRLASEIWRLRRSVTFHQRILEHLDRRLVALCKERDALKKGREEPAPRRYRIKP